MGQNTDDAPKDDPLVDLGTPGASARARYERLRRRDDRRRRQAFGRFAPAVSFLVGSKPSTEAWARGAEGEERVGPYLSRRIGDIGVVLHDRRIPGSRANLDHVAIVPSGVWVIDAKHSHGRLEGRNVGGWFVSRQVLYVGRRAQTARVQGAQRQRDVVVRHVAPGVTVRAALCFTGVDVPLLARPFTVDGVLVTWPKALAKTLTAPGPLDAVRRRELAAALARAFPAYATDHLHGERRSH